MGIAKAQFYSILTNIFGAGKTIKLLSALPDETTEVGAVTIGQPYTIQSGDFTVDTDKKNEIYSAKNMMMYLCETTGGDGTAVGFAVYSGSTLLYFGSFTDPMVVGYNTVPTIKKYDASKGEGVKVTLTSTDVS